MRRSTIAQIDAVSAFISWLSTDGDDALEEGMLERYAEWLELHED